MSFKRSASYFRVREPGSLFQDASQTFVKVRKGQNQYNNILNHSSSSHACVRPVSLRPMAVWKCVYVCVCVYGELVVWTLRWVQDPRVYSLGGWPMCGQNKLLKGASQEWVCVVRTKLQKLLFTSVCMQRSGRPGGKGVRWVIAWTLGTIFIIVLEKI